MCESSWRAHVPNNVRGFQVLVWPCKPTLSTSPDESIVGHHVGPAVLLQHAVQQLQQSASGDTEGRQGAIGVTSHSVSQKRGPWQEARGRRIALYKRGKPAQLGIVQHGQLLQHGQLCICAMSTGVRAGSPESNQTIPGLSAVQHTCSATSQRPAFSQADTSDE